MITAPNTVICPSFSVISQLSGTAKPAMDLPPWLLMENGCYPAPRVLVKVIEVKGNFIGVHLPRAADKTRVWWAAKYPSGQNRHG